MKYDTPYVLFYKEREPGLRTMARLQSAEKEGKVPHAPIFKDGAIVIPETLKKFIETDNESYLKEKEYR